MKTSHITHKLQLKQTAQNLINQGFSVIPIHGNNYPAQPKKPATSWKIFQKRLPKRYEIDNWFTQDITAIGIICGVISHLMVLDFDDHLIYHSFCKEFPTFSNTYTVKTRRGYHLYFKVDQHIRTHHFSGGDVKGDRSYVIAPPSIINGVQYQVIKDTEYLDLLPNDIDDIFNYLQIRQHSFSSQAHLKANIPILNLSNMYNDLAPKLGRNNALYRVASFAHNHHIDQRKVEAELIFHHITYPSPPNHPSEGDNDRFIEAQRTIESAYRSRSINYMSFSGIPNSVREKLLQTQKSTVFPRLLDIFSLAHWKPGRQFTMSQAINLCNRYGLNRKSVIQALTGKLSTIGGQYIIIRSYAEYPDNRGLNFPMRGRPTEMIFQVPAIDDLIKLLNVRWSPSDKITFEDIKTAHQYRLALHREYIKRLKPEVPIGWLADRLGVNVRTIQRYNLELDVQKTQNLAYFWLSKSNLDSLPKRHSKITKNATNGFWLETDDGTRYPAWRHIGSNLLKLKSEPVKVCVQKPSKLMLADVPINCESVVWHPIAPSEFIKVQAFRSCTEDRPTLTQVVNNLFTHVKKRVNRVRYFKFQLHFDSVVHHIAKDDVAETITSYLYAYDDDGNEVYRPAKQGIAYRMLKEFGNGNVYLALLDIQTEMWYSLARHAMRFGYPAAAMRYLLTALE